MKSIVNQSTFSFILTILVIGLLVAGSICTYGTDKFILLLAVTVTVLTAGMIYGPMSVSADSNEINVHSSFKIHSIPMRRVVSVERFQPTMGCTRLLGSGGFMGYWGIFREGDVGRYMAFYGQASHCFMVRLDNGDKYVLGCKDTDAMVKYIKSQITAPASPSAPSSSIANSTSRPSEHLQNALRTIKSYRCKVTIH